MCKQDVLGHAIRILLSEPNHECHHEREQTRGLSEGEPQNGVRKQLGPQTRVASHTGDERPKDGPNTDTCSCKTDCGHPSTNGRSGFGDGRGELAGVGTNGLTADEVTGGLIEDLLALEGLEGRFGNEGGLVSSEA